MPEEDIFPPLLDNQDQVVIRLDLRRTDPENVNHTAEPDISNLGEITPAIAAHMMGICYELGFDPDASCIAIVKVRDAEGPTGVMTLTDFNNAAGPL